MDDAAVADRSSPEAIACRVRNSSRPRAMASSLEVVAEAEVAQHLEEGVVVGGAADVVDVAGAKALLAGGGPREFQLDLAQEVVLELVHAGGREQHRGVPGRHEHVGGAAGVPLGLEEFKVFFAEFVGLHGSCWEFFRGGAVHDIGPGAAKVRPAARRNARERRGTQGNAGIEAASRRQVRPARSPRKPGPRASTGWRPAAARSRPAGPAQSRRSLPAARPARQRGAASGRGPGSGGR